MNVLNIHAFFAKGYFLFGHLKLLRAAVTAEGINSSLLWIRLGPTRN